MYRHREGSPADNMTSFPEQQIQVSIIDNIGLNPPGILSQLLCDPSSWSLNWGYS